MVGGTPHQESNPGQLLWTRRNVWNNEGDSATLLDPSGKPVSVLRGDAEQPPCRIVHTPASEAATAAAQAAVPSSYVAPAEPSVGVSAKYQTASYTATATATATESASASAAEASSVSPPKMSSLEEQQAAALALARKLGRAPAACVGFEHAHRAMWTGWGWLRFPRWASPKANGVSLAHADGRGWYLDVKVRAYVCVCVWVLCCRGCLPSHPLAACTGHCTLGGHRDSLPRSRAR